MINTYKMNLGITMSDKLIPQEIEGFNFGMNDVDNIKKLPPQVVNYLHNAYPDKSLKPLNGITDIDSTSTPVNSVEAFYSPVSLHIYMDGVDYLFVITEKYVSIRTGRGEWGLEIWDITNTTRHQWFEWEYNGPYTAGAWDGSKFQDTQNYHVEFSLTKRYNSVYLTMTHRPIWDFQCNGGNGLDRHIIKNKIFDWDSSASLWVQREMGFETTPNVGFFNTIPTDYAKYQPATFFDTTMHNGKMFKTGGYIDGPYAWSGVVDRHLYYTVDGVNWQIHSILPQEYVVGCQLISFKNQLYFFTARSAAGASYADDVYRYDETDGWYAHDQSTPWSNREGFQVLVYDNKVWVIGGRYTDGVEANDIYYNTVYSSSDLKTWSTVTSSAIAGISGFAYQGSVVYDNKMWIIGGVFDDGVGTVEPKKAVYSSTDGSTWSNIGTIPTTGTGRHNMGIAVFNDKMFVVGGYGLWSGLWVGSNFFDAQSSSDGSTWTTENSTAFSGILTTYTPEMENFHGSLLLVLNDVAWSSTDGATYNRDVGGVDFSKYYSYAFTYVRRTDKDSKLSDDTSFGSIPVNYKFTNWNTIGGRTVISPDEKLLTGTISVSGNNVTGSSTLFSSELSVGDYLRIGGTFKYYEILTITNNTTMTVGNSFSDSYTAAEYALIPTVGNNITTDVYHTGDLEGVEDINNRILVFSSTSDSASGYNNVLEIPKRIYDEVNTIWYDPGEIQGATHVRVYRTLGHSTKSVAQGLPHRYLCDINITGDDEETDSIMYIDETSDDYLTGVTHYLEMTPYSPPPYARYSIWANHIYWLSGITEYDVLDIINYGNDDSFKKTDGRVYYSVNPKSGDVSFDALNPQKFGSMFNLQKDYKECNTNDGQKDAGFAELAGDLYVFKENSIFMIRNADPINNPEEISPQIGCACPHTITKADVPIFGGSIVFFYSGQGWAYLLPGGQVKLFIDFKISDIQQYAGILKRNATGQTDQPTDWYSRTKVSAAFWNDTLWMFYGDNADDQSQINEAAAANGTLKIACFHFSPDQESNGPFIRDFSSISTKYEPQVLIPVDNNRAYTFSHIDEYKLTRWNDPTKYIDTLIESDTPTTYSNNIKVITRAYPSDPQGVMEWLCKYVMVHMDFEDEETFTIKIYTDVNKQVATCSFSQVRNSGMTQYSDNQYRDFITITTQHDLRHAFYHHLEITKQIPSSGSIEHHGMRFALCDQHKRVDPEHTGKFGSASNVTFVVEADTDPEVNAHA